MKLLRKIITTILLLSTLIPLTAAGIKSEEPKNKDLLIPSATISGTTTACQNSAQPQITFTGSGGVAPYTFVYSINGVTQPALTTVETDDAISIGASTAVVGTFNYNLISVTDANNSFHAQTGLATATIVSLPDPALGGTGSGSIVNGMPVFKVCLNGSSVFTLTNTSTTTAINTEYTINWGDGSPNFTATSWNSTTHTYNIGLWTLTYSVKGANGCVSTKIYTVFVGSNPAVSLGNPGNTDICIGSSLTFPITGISNNPPGTTYTVTFNDGSPSQTYNHPPPTSITHTFPIHSCGTTSSDGSNTYPNSFSVNIVATNPCSSSSVGVVPIYVSAIPEAHFGGPDRACVNTEVCFANASEGYQIIGSICYEPNVVWSISPATGYTISNGSQLGNDFGSMDASLWQLGSQNLCAVFHTPGTYTITIKSGSKCGLNDYVDVETRTICIEAPLTPQFTLSAAEGCSPLAVTTTNTTDLTNQCPPPSYHWSVAYAAGNCGNSAGYTFTNGSGASSTAPSFNFVEAGTYTITMAVTNSCGTNTTSSVVKVKKPPMAVIDPIANICQSTSSITINPSANINSCVPTGSALTYLWSFPGGTPATSTSKNPGTITYTGSGNYTVSLSVTNECGTTIANNEVFSIFPLPTISGTLFTCVNSTSQLTASIPGNANSWSSLPTGIVTISNNGLVTGISAGTTTIKYTDINGCSVTVPFTVNPLPAATISGTTSICVNSAAQITLTGQNGVAPYTFTYNINNGPDISVPTTSGNSVVINVPTATAGVFTYTLVSVVDSNTVSCVNNQTGSATVTVNPFPVITVQPLASQNICVGASINALTAHYLGGAGLVSYQWFSNSTNSTTGGTPIPGATLATYSPPAFNTPGTFYYYVQISLSASGCGTVTSTLAEVVVSPDPTIITQPLVAQTQCQGSAATDLTVVATAGNSGTLNYQWYSNTTNSNTGGMFISGATTPTYTPSTATIGTLYYYCVITQAGLGCEVTSNVSTVVVLMGPAIVNQPQPSTVCQGVAPTLLTVSYSNGIGTPTYQWYSNTINSNAGGTAIPGANGASYAPPSNVVGTLFYYCTITFSSGGCNNIISDTAQVTINQGLLIASRNLTICTGDSFSVTPGNTNGDIVPLGTTYTWAYPTISPAGTVTGASSQSSPQNSINQTLVNTSASPATVVYTITPFSGSCVGDDFNITVIVNPSINPNAVVANSTCHSANNGSITTNITGGTPYAIGDPYHILWVGPNGFTSTAANISGLMPGVYTLTIEAGCTYTNTYTVTEPTDLVLTTDSVKNITCFGDNDGLISITVFGGTSPYTYAWTKNGLPFSTVEDISNLGPGIYTVSVTDANSCGPRMATFNLTEPTALTVSLVNQTSNLCYGGTNGTINISTTGGTPVELTAGVFGYIYAWTGPNGFMSNTQNLNNLQAGTYNVLVTDNSGCTTSLSVTLTQSTEIIISATTTPISCYGSNNASISVTVSGGNPAYQISWSNLATGLNQNNLAPGDYTITVTDASGCQKALTINIPDVPVFSVNPVVTNVSCYGAQNGSIALNFAGGTNGITLVWSDGNASGTTRNNLGPGTYTVTISNGTPCNIVRTFVILEPLDLTLSATTQEPTDCSNSNNGAINLLVTGGTPPYSYVWSNGATTEDLLGVVAGNYSVVVTDLNGCTKQAQYTLNGPESIVLTVVTDSTANCEDFLAQQIFTAQTSGGIPPYQFVWSSGTVSGANGQIMTTSQNGLITLQVTDAAGCMASYSYNVSLPTLSNPPSFETISIGYSTYGMYSIGDPIQFTNTATGDFVSMIWDFGDGTYSNEENPVHTYQIAKDYVVTQTITYPYGCVYVNKITLIVEKGYVLVVPTGFTPNGDSVNDTYRPVTRALKNVRMDVYDTWGSLLYSEKGEVLKGWDGVIKGTNAENGNYYCKVSAETFYGTIINADTPFTLIK